MRQLIETRVVAVPASRRVERKTETSHTITWEPDGHKQGTIELYIDVEALSRSLGGRAVKSRSGKARLAHGMIEARVIKGSITRHPKKES